MANVDQGHDQNTLEAARGVAEALSRLLSGGHAPSKAEVSALGRRLVALDTGSAAAALDQLSWVEGLEGVAAIGPLHAADGPVREVPELRDARDAFERAYLRAVLKRTRGNVTAAAKLAGRNRTDFYELLHRRKVSPREHKAQ